MLNEEIPWWLEGVGICDKPPVVVTDCWSDSDCKADEYCKSLYDDGFEGSGSGSDAMMEPPDGVCTPKETKGECVVSGCSGEICADDYWDSACVWEDAYACLKLASCGTLADGSCGWITNEKYYECLEEIECGNNEDCG